MIDGFGNKTAAGIWREGFSKALPKMMHLRVHTVLTIMHSTSNMRDLLVKGQPPGLRLHKMKGDKKDYWSITIDLPYCITFRFKNGIFYDVRIENYHRG